MIGDRRLYAFGRGGRMPDHHRHPSELDPPRPRPSAGRHRAVAPAHGRRSTPTASILAVLLFIACTVAATLTPGQTLRGRGSSSAQLIDTRPQRSTSHDASPTDTPTRTGSSTSPTKRRRASATARTSTTARRTATHRIHESQSPPPSQPGGCVGQPQGIPSAGPYVGAAVSGDASLSGVEQSAGRQLAIHRTYFLADQVDAAIKSVKADLAAGRLPWISFKLPYSWADMAAGRGDAWTINLADRLATVGGPVWLAFHHEPEGDGNMQDWKRMQQHLAPIIHARTNNVAYTIILIAWNSFFGPDASQHLDQVYPGSQYVDILGMDVYNEYGAKAGKKTLDPMEYFRPIGAFARAHDVKWAVAETGYTKQAASVDPHWLQSAYADMKAEGGVALTYFDSSLNSIADWTLDDRVRADAFRGLLASSPRICTG
jgi:hypothetical protein